MKTNICKFFAIVPLCLGMLPLTSAQAAIHSIASMNITSGGFVVYDFYGQPVVNPSAVGIFTPFTALGSNTNLVGGYLGSTTSGVVSGLWYDTPAHFYTASTNLGSTAVPAGTIQGGNVPSGTLDDVTGTITMDLSAFFASWSSEDFQQGTGKNDGVTSALAAGSWNSNSGYYNLTWNTNIDFFVCGPLGETCTAKYTLEGYASPNAVPVPAAALLFGSGLIGLAGVARKHKTNK